MNLNKPKNELITSQNSGLLEGIRGRLKSRLSRISLSIFLSGAISGLSSTAIQKAIVSEDTRARINNLVDEEEVSLLNTRTNIVELRRLIQELKDFSDEKLDDMLESLERSRGQVRDDFEVRMQEIQDWRLINSNVSQFLLETSTLESDSDYANFVDRLLAYMANLPERVQYYLREVLQVFTTVIESGVEPMIKFLMEVQARITMQIELLILEIESKFHEIESGLSTVKAELNNYQIIANQTVQLLNRFYILLLKGVIPLAFWIPFLILLLPVYRVSEFLLRTIVSGKLVQADPAELTAQIRDLTTQLSVTNQQLANLLEKAENHTNNLVTTNTEQIDFPVGKEEVVNAEEHVVVEK